jgi:hypothetical protein
MTEIINTGRLQNTFSIKGEGYIFKLPQERICLHLKTILETAVWINVSAPPVFLGMTLWDPSVQSLPLITIVPRMEKATDPRYGRFQCELPVEITALLPMENGENPMKGVVIADEIADHIFAARQSNWEGFPEELIDINYLEGGIVSYPDELNPQLLTAGITIQVKYEKEI